MPLSDQNLRKLSAHLESGGQPGDFVPTKKKVRNNEEFKIQCAVVAWWATACKGFGVPEILLWHTPNSAVYGGSEAQREKMGAMLKRLGQRSGVPDLFLAVPRKYSEDFKWGASETRTLVSVWCGLFLELKAPKGVVSPEQTIIMAELQKQGYKCVVCRSLDECKAAITEYLSK